MKTSQQDPHDEASSMATVTDDAEISLQIMASNPNPVTEIINRATPHISGPDAFEPVATIEAPKGEESYREAGDEIFDTVSRGRKIAIVAVLSFGAFLSPISSTSVLAATPEVASTYNTSGSITNVSNAAYMIVMALSPLFWGPMSQVYGRRVVSTAYTV
jgi:hypothetical protein